MQQAIDEGRLTEGGARASRNRLQTPVLLDAVRKHRFDALVGGARRDEEKARAKERVFSVRDEFGQWDPKNQRPELWSLYNTRGRRGPQPDVHLRRRRPQALTRSTKTRPVTRLGVAPWQAVRATIIYSIPRRSWRGHGRAAAPTDPQPHGALAHLMDEQRRRTGRTRRPRPRSPGNAALARDWAWELACVEDLGCSRREAELRLRGVVDTLVGLLLAESFSAQLAREVGACLVDLNATQPEALRRTLLLLTDRLLDGQQRSGEAGRYRLTRLLIELTAGWAEAAHKHVLTAQDEVHSFGDTRQHRPRDSAPSPNPWFGAP